MDFANHLKSSVDIVQVIADRVKLQRAGGHAFKGLCPFHQEKTPSFHVRGDRQYFYCFGCHKKGSVIDFVMELDGYTFWEACVSIAERFGIPLPKRTEHQDEKTRQRAGIYEAHDIALDLYRSALRSPAGKEARDYIQRRGVPQALIDEFGLGLADRSGQMLVRRLQAKGFSPEQLRDTGLAVERQDGSGFFDRFRGRLMFPIQNEMGKVIGFAGRALSDEEQPKYLNSPETELYHKSHVLYNLHRARKAMRDQDHAILVEGYMDVIGLFGGGVTEAVASCGTALVNQQVRILHRHTDSVIVNFDPDTAGVNATERSIDMLLEEGLRIRVLGLPEELDPDEFVQQYGADAYRDLLKKAPRYFDWLADRARTRFDFRTAEGRVDALKFLLPSIQRVPDKLERIAVANDLASYLRLDPGMILDQFRRSAADRSAPAKVKVAEHELPAAERLLLRCLITSEQARDEVLPRLRDLKFAQPPVAKSILNAFVSLGPDYSVDALMGRLDEKERILVAGMLFVDESHDGQADEQMLAEQAVECLRALEAVDRGTQYAALKARITDAEKAGNLTEALALSEELSRLGQSNRRRRSTGVE
ncbi:MAG: DNA primase [Bryobacterales bacterium]|nr:DNA primase [Bryobacterales bacterium]